ncbi:Hypothetical predicted protein [Pelobates cultripes]|uniref:Uncharacterized protein n=1 Tax=Pelobates cultripes TaxID=61616 RepID=A0AAD1SZY9_PELCU|nr:Hypothetical predicted protein [Pelobates cultripes]
MGNNREQPLRKSRPPDTALDASTSTAHTYDYPRHLQTLAQDLGCLQGEFVLSTPVDPGNPDPNPAPVQRNIPIPKME